MILARTVLPSATLSPVVPIQDTGLSFHDFCEESFAKWGNVLLGSPSYIHINKREHGSIGTDMANVFARRSQIVSNRQPDLGRIEPWWEIRCCDR